MLVTLEHALRHLRLLVGEAPDPITQHEDAVEVEFKAKHATAIVLNYVTDPDGNTWTAETVPGAVQASVLLVLSDLWEHRAGSADEDVFLSKSVQNLLRTYRDPTLA
jgi:hypothetical protein